VKGVPSFAVQHRSVPCFFCACQVCAVSREESLRIKTCGLTSSPPAPPGACPKNPAPSPKEKKNLSGGYQVASILAQQRLRQPCVGLIKSIARPLGLSECFRFQFCNFVIMLNGTHFARHIGHRCPGRSAAGQKPKGKQLYWGWSPVIFRFGRYDMAVPWMILV